jgi:hypothetical protein
VKHHSDTRLLTLISLVWVTPFVCAVAAAPAATRALQVEARPASGTLEGENAPRSHTMVPGKSGLSLGSGWTLVTWDITDKSTSPTWSLKAEFPQIIGTLNPQAREFNKTVQGFVSKGISAFKESCREIQGSMPPGMKEESYLLASYRISAAGRSLIGVKLDSEEMISMMAHPRHDIRTLNYDLSTTKPLELASVFKPGSDYLRRIAAFCAEDLRKRDVLQFEEGVLPLEKNYTTWNLHAEGLLVYFREYQVAAYVFGPQEVFIPYSAIRDVLAPAGPAAPFLKH